MVSVVLGVKEGMFVAVGVWLRRSDLCVLTHQWSNVCVQLT